ncbi:hypothetical protein SMY46_003231 [Cronobacter turicensis]|jgi:hypothetical protein|uniref:Uncharacterized protein n=1 Tax=Cronobacter turicensis (strain DSM 18703 / CCUG 55852 / LMG 23827 / z3032) TaxID=693216 RepID=C9Y4B9_CROTZ|nr:hypothetical protein [Cronobacter turicensis]CBA30859.1 unknown protein [Cronobacter turicensis z3032]EGT5680399.1 hypothetical protein [Cronobacter turicensis]EGT5738596.1 hypothetical protein [Cronobacter turicensis]EGT5742690.1 hypothetical protein [Cronobacter turicensis]EKM0362577.1 hypothetical protein [Cronobacter turicensis]
MLRIFRSLFTSPEKLVHAVHPAHIQDAIDEGERIIIDEDGNASVNVACLAVQEDFARHVEMLKRA